MQFDYQQLMETAEVSLSNAIGMHIMCDRPHTHFMHDLIEKYGKVVVQEALKDESLLKLMDTIEGNQNPDAVKKKGWP